MFVTELCVVARPEPGEWALTQPLIWQTPNLRIVVPINFITDLASIPAALRGVLNVEGLSRRPAVAHDFLYCAQTVSREDADEFLRTALIAEGESPFTAKLYWMGVRAGGGSHWDVRPAGLQPADFAAALGN
jgi:hypothetical protein